MALNLDYIMGLVMNAGKEVLKTDAAAAKGNRKPVLNEIFVAWIKDMLTELVRNILEKQDADKDEIIIKQSETIEQLKTQINELGEEVNDLRFQLDCNKQQQLQDSVKITGVEMKEGENVKEIVKHIAEHTMGLDLQDADISTAYRINTKYDPESATERTTTGRPAKIPTIVVKYTKRDTKSAQIKAKRQIKNKPGCKYPNAEIYEEVTPVRSRIMYALRKKVDEAGNRKFKYVWSSNGKILVRTEEEAKMDTVPRPKAIQKPEDLIKYGWTEDEVAKIIRNIKED